MSSEVCGLLLHPHGDIVYSTTSHVAHHRTQVNAAFVRRDTVGLDALAKALLHAECAIATLVACTSLSERDESALIELQEQHGAIELALRDRQVCFVQ